MFVPSLTQSLAPYQSPLKVTPEGRRLCPKSSSPLTDRSNLVFVPDELDSHLVKIQFIVLGQFVQVRVAGFAEHITVLVHLDALHQIMDGGLFRVLHLGRPGKSHAIHELTHWKCNVCGPVTTKNKTKQNKKKQSLASYLFFLR